jgi:hypothetical protein
MATNLYQYYTEQKKPMPSIDERGQLFEQYGLGKATDYAGNIGQNTQLLGKLQGGEAATPAQTAIQAPIAPKTTVGSGGGVNMAVQGNSGGVSTGQPAQNMQQVPVVDPKQQFDDLNAKLKDFQLKQESDPAYTYKKSIEDLASQAPEAPDYATEYKNFAAAQGLDQTQAEITGLDTQIAEYQAQVEKETYGEEGRIARMSIINTRKNKIAENAKIELNRLYNRKAVLQNSLQMKNDTIANLMNMTQQSYSNSLAQYNMKLESYDKIASMFDRQEQREFDRDQAEKKTAAANLAVLQDSVKDFVLGGGSFDTLPDAMKNQIETLEIAQGLPRGTTAQLIGELQPEEKEIWKGLSDDGTTLSVLVQGANGPEVRTYATGLPAKETGDGFKNMPSSYKEWSLAGGAEGTGKSYGDFLKGNKSGSETTQEEYQYERAERVITNVDDVLSNVHWYNTGGLGWAMQNIGGTPAYDLDKMVDQLKANIGFQELQAMRAASPTGGALGQVAVRELELLQSVLGSIEVGQSTGQLKKSLVKIKTHFENWKATVDQAKGGVQVGQSNANFVVDGFQFPTQEAADAYKKETGITK